MTLYAAKTDRGCALSVDAGGFAADPARLRDAAGRAAAALAAIVDASAAAGSALTTAAGAATQGRLAEALSAFAHELSARSELLGEAVRAGATALERTAQDYEASDRAAAGALNPGLEGTMFGGSWDDLR